MKLEIYKNSIRKKIGELIIEDKNQVREFLVNNKDNGYSYVIEGEKYPVRIN